MSCRHRVHPRARARTRVGLLAVAPVLVVGGAWGAPGGVTPADATAASVQPCVSLLEPAQARIDQVLAQLEADPVLIEDGAVQLSQDQRDQVREAVRESPEPLRVAALTGLPDDVDPTLVACALANSAPQATSVVVLLGPDRFPALGGDTTVGADQATAERTYVAVDADRDETGSEAERLVLLVDRVSGRAPLPSDRGPSGSGAVVQEPDATVRSGRGLVLGIVLGAVALVAAVVVLRLARRRGSDRRTRRLLSSVRHGRSTGADIATRRAVRELGDRLDRLEIGRDDDAGAWQRALDAYATATRQLDAATGRADLEQVTRQCEQGQDELDRIERARTGRRPS